MGWDELGRNKRQKSGATVRDLDIGMRSNIILFMSPQIQPLTCCYRDNHLLGPKRKNIPATLGVSSPFLSCIFYLLSNILVVGTVPSWMCDIEETRKAT